MTGQFTRRELAALAAVGCSSPIRAQPRFGDMLWDYVREYLRVLDDQRAGRLASAVSKADFATLRARVRSELTRMWGPFPARSPLTPRQLGSVDADDHWIERLVFESRPGFHVTANLYRPRRASGRIPAVIFSCGHAADGKAAASYRQFCALLARNGVAALTWDPVGQGERHQLIDPETGTSSFRPGTGEHRVLGDRCYLVGGNLMNFRAWDAARALDYLESRPEFDADRLGLAGQSGGGMVTLQFACFDDRVRAAFASCAVASFRAKTEALLIADPEQVLYGTLRAGIDHPELLAAFAPKPLLIGAAIRDYVPIEATRRTHAELRDVYSKLGEPGNLSLVETDDTHGLNRELREAGAAFFRRAFGVPGRAVGEAEAGTPRPVAELQCSPAGQVGVSFGSRSVLDMLREKADEIAPVRRLPRSASEFEVYRSEVAGKIRDVTRVGAFKAEYGIEVPSRFLDVGIYAKGTVFLVADQGKDHPLVQRYVIDSILAAGHSVYGLDPRGWGVTAPSMPGAEVSYEWDDFFAYRSIELGRPLLGQRLKDLLSTAPRLTRRRNWCVVGVGVGGLVAAHAAALDPRVTGVISIQALASFRSVLDNPRATHPVSSFLPGVLAAYEVRDLYASIAPRPLLIVNPQDATGGPLERQAADREFAWAESVYEALDARAALQLECGVGRAGVRDLIKEWIASLGD